jgi:hypothetical protein
MRNANTNIPSRVYALKDNELSKFSQVCVDRISDTLPLRGCGGADLSNANRLLRRGQIVDLKVSDYLIWFGFLPTKDCLMKVSGRMAFRTVFSDMFRDMAVQTALPARLSRQIYQLKQRQIPKLKLAVACSLVGLCLTRG